MSGFSSVELLYWTPAKGGEVGHIALEVKNINNIADFYVSYWPYNERLLESKQNKCCSCKWLFSQPGVFHSQEDDDKELKSKPERIKINFLELDIERISDKYLEIRKYAADHRWHLLAQAFPLWKRRIGHAINSNCSVMVMNLLVQGGIERHIPKYKKFGSIYYFLLLSSTRLFSWIPFSFAANYPIFKSPDDLPERHPLNLFGGALLMVSISSLGLSFSERFFEQKRLLPKNPLTLTKTDDLIVSIGSLTGSLFLLSMNNFVNPLVAKRGTGIIIATDLAILIASLTTMVLSEYILSCLLALCKKGHAITPLNVYHWVKSIKEIRSFESNLYLSNREWLFAIPFFIEVISSYLFRTADYEGSSSYHILPAFALPISFFVLSYIDTRLKNKYLKQESNVFDLESRSFFDYGFSASFVFLTGLLAGGVGFSYISSSSNEKSLWQGFGTGLCSIVGFFLGVCFISTIFKRRSNRDYDQSLPIHLEPSPVLSKDLSHNMDNEKIENNSKEIEQIVFIDKQSEQFSEQPLMVKGSS